MKKIILIIILLAISIAAASAKTTLNLDSIFANTLAFEARLDTAVYVARPNIYPINDDPYIGNTYKIYRDAIKCYNMIKNNQMKKSLIPEVLECMSKYYEPYFASLLQKPIAEPDQYKTVYDYSVDFGNWYRLDNIRHYDTRIGSRLLKWCDNKYKWEY